MARFTPAAWLRRQFYLLRTEGQQRGDPAALGVGAFIGCLPLPGAHLLLVAVAGRLLRLNRIKMYAAANISNPVMAPALIFVELQTGAWLRRGEPHPLTLDAIRQTGVWTLGLDLGLGALVVGALVGGSIALLAAAAVARRHHLPPYLEAIFARAADRYFTLSLTGWEFARIKLRRDPIYRAALSEPLPRGGTLVDIGCGQGLTLAVLSEARRQHQIGEWPVDVPPPPAFDRIIGIELRRRVARMARTALGGEVAIVEAAAPEGLPARFAAALVFDVLHLMGHDDQQRLMTGVFERLSAEGVVLVRDVDANAGLGFEMVRWGNRLKNTLVGRPLQRFHFRSADAWTEFFRRQGWEVEMRPMSEGTPFANRLFRLTKP